jgi:hypothetical protein
VKQSPQNELQIPTASPWNSALRIIGTAQNLRTAAPKLRGLREYLPERKKCILLQSLQVTLANAHSI